ncbi:1-acylglycerol-3-phosphate O-acyltransferase Pnpla3-like [Gigantopelta aegis]|uniref:1-acylglycerol-3-phosphate O-acyltransferase Pnpla3-like n=1 Tax=Gigantopelta aegis TaxID=1735272 RepID=UPI001B889917|nr:1-acylglycerol-3-phosphate O-acyltransferase Pnpla3-like [Gigantopelta aegis]
MSVSFSGCGFLGIYHIGVASCIKEHAPHFLDSGRLLGASAGAITACCFICGCCLGECTSFVLRLASKARSRTLGPLHPSFDINRILRDVMLQVLPLNAHLICSGRLYVSMTRVHDKKNVIISQYDSREELIEALLCSAFVPFYSGMLPPKFRGVRYVDGSLSDNLPTLDEDTITVSPFAGECDICPMDNSSNFMHINIVNHSLQCTAGNLYRLSHALFPPHPEVLSQMCRQGFDDALVFLQSNNLISCTRHLTVRSCFMTNARQNDEETEVAEDECDGDHHHDDNCDECKKKLHGALVDSLPPSVMLAFQAACDSVNKGMVNYLFSFRPVKLLSFAMTPWFLPAEILLNLVVKFLEWLPKMPQDLQLLCQESVSILKAVYFRVLHHHPTYSARFTCQLAITEVQNQKERTETVEYQPRSRAMTFPRSAMHKRKSVVQTDLNRSVVRNFNIGFVVDFNSAASESVRSLENLEHGIDKLQLDDIHVEQSGPDGDLVYHPHIGPDAPTRPGGACQEVFDTFDQCLNVTNQMESVLSYYYEDENNKGCYKFEEIFSLKNVDVNTSSSTGVVDDDLHGGAAAADGGADLSWDSYLEMKPEIEEELEALIDSALRIPQLQS